MQIKFKKLSEFAKVPAFAHASDAGFDLCTIEEVKMQPGESRKFKTGLAMEIPTGYALLIWDKSSIGSQELKTFCGVIDSGYRGEIILMLKNFGEREKIFNIGDKVAQGLIQKIENVEFVETDVLSETTRGEGSFGSTGK